MTKVRVTLKAYRSPAFVFEATETVMIELRGPACGSDAELMVETLKAFNLEREAIADFVRSRGGQVEKR